MRAIVHRSVWIAAVVGLAWSWASGSTPRNEPAALPPLPHPLASFGAAVEGDWLYVYSGHTGKAHAHSRRNLVDGFYRVHLAKPQSWQSLPAGPPLQGLAMVAHGGRLFRIGGLDARNEPQQDEDLHSVASVAAFDPATNVWRDLPPMPEPRSSHDAAVTDGKVYVFGGWSLEGAGGGKAWHDHGLVADLTVDPIQWKPIAQPFHRRALTVAAANGKVYAIGGLTRAGETSDRVDIYDTATGQWRRGPDLTLDDRMKGFGASAFAVKGAVYLSGGGADLWRLSADETAWQKTGFQLARPRFFHRMIPAGDDRLLFIAGASKGDHLADIESVTLSQLPKAASTTGAIDAPPAAHHANWPGFRGGGDSHTHVPAERLPLKWSETEHVAWRAPLDGYGQSSPVVWADRVFVTTADGPMKQTMIVTCFDLATGERRWQRRFEASQQIERSDYVSKAAPTPAIDAARLYVFFESGDLIALDHDGQTLWQRSLTKEYGPFEGNHGVGASPAQSADALFVLIDHGAPGYLLCIDKNSGQNRWKIDRPKRVSWSSPIVSNRAGRTEVLISSNGVVESFDAADGSRLWFVEGLEKNTVCSPSFTDDWVIVGSTERQSCVAVARGGEGDVSGTHVRWRAETASATFSSPLIHRDRVYMVNNAGVAFCLDLSTGKERWAHRLPAACWASPLAAGGRVYFFCKNGATVVLDADAEQPTVLAESSIPVPAETRQYGYAVAGPSLLLRSGAELFCIRR